MFDEELEDDELEADESEDISLEDVAAEEIAADSTADDDDDDLVAAEEKPSGKAKAQEPDLPSIEAKQKDRDALALAMEEFLAKGGKVQELASSED